MNRLLAFLLTMVLLALACALELAVRAGIVALIWVVLEAGGVVATPVTFDGAVALGLASWLARFLYGTHRAVVPTEE